MKILVLHFSAHKTCGDKKILSLSSTHNECSLEYVQYVRTTIRIYHSQFGSIPSINQKGLTYLPVAASAVVRCSSCSTHIPIPYFAHVSSLTHILLQLPTSCFTHKNEIKLIIVFWWWWWLYTYSTHVCQCTNGQKDTK